MSAVLKARAGTVHNVLRRAVRDGQDDNIFDPVSLSQSILESDLPSLDVMLCGGASPEELERLEGRVRSFLTARGEGPDGAVVRKSAVSSLSPYAGLSAEELLLDKRYPNRVRFWRRVFELGIDSPSGCDDVARRLRISSAMSEVSGEALGVSVTLDSATVTAACALGIVAAISLLPQVCSVELAPKIRVADRDSQWIAQGGNGRSRERPFWEQGIAGKGEVVAISDTGVDTDNCYFRDVIGTARDGGIYPDRRKVIQYDPYADNVAVGGGHGTRCAAAIAGHRSDDGQNEGNGTADGVARDAKLAVIDVGRGVRPGLVIPGDKTRLLRTGREAGARIHSASWGGGPQPVPVRHHVPRH